MNDSALIAMSGGVDSCVAAYLAARQGLQCTGVTLHLWEDTANAAGARCAAQKLGMEFQELDAREPFRIHVVEPFVRAYEAGLTPNPCVRCNQQLKFGYLLDWALSQGMDYIVSGHYAQIRRDPNTGRYLLYKAAHIQKDQSYFLAGLTQDQLAHILFPLGTLTKEQVRQIAREQGFQSAGQKDSQDICFVPDGDYVSMMERYRGVPYCPGSFLDREGKPIGTHKGAVAYTLGQRKGLGLAMGEPVYVCSKDMAANTVTVGPETLLFTTALRAGDLNWLPFDAPTGPMEVQAKVRSRHKEQPVTLYPEGDTCRVEFREPQRAVTPGQAVVFYQDDLVIGSGTIL